MYNYLHGFQTDALVGLDIRSDGVLNNMTVFTWHMNYTNLCIASRQSAFIADKELLPKALFPISRI